MMNWRIDADYAFCAELDLSGWAWQFLRRNPFYQSDYAAFIKIWLALEAEYGTPPNRDFFKWKQDPRAWRDVREVAGCGTEICPGENDQVLIECWMGAKWGFRKFPIDPRVEFPEQLSWRESDLEIEVLDSKNVELALAPEKLGLLFDLSLPLPAQLEAAKHHLITVRTARARAGVLPPRHATEGADVWRRWLRLLDAVDSGATPADMLGILGPRHLEQEIDAAEAMRGGGYLRLLKLQN